MDERTQELLEGIRKGLNANISTEEAVALMDPEIVIDWSRSLAPYRAVVSGRQAAESYLRDFRDTWAEMNFVYELDSEYPNGSVVLATSISPVGAGSGVQTPTARGSQFIAFRNGLISEMRLFQNPADANVFARLRERRDRLAKASLYLVCESLPNGEEPTRLLEAAVEGGVDVIQMREKAPRCAEEIAALAEPFARIAREANVLFFLNDQPELVERAGADGVHVGQDDTPVAEARALAGPGALVGLSTHSPEQFDAALAAEGESRPDQLSVGPVWETPTKPGRPATGLELVAHAAGSDPDLAWFAIGGIDLTNISAVAQAGASRAVVVRAIRDAEDPSAAARVLRDALANRQT